MTRFEQLVFWNQLFQDDKSGLLQGVNLTAILNCNISKLQDAATVWKSRYEAITKISYFRGKDANPHTLLFEINPAHKPKHGYAFEILHSFSHIYKQPAGNGQAKRLRIGTRDELIETCETPDPNHPDIYITEWQFFVKLDDTYFEKQINDSASGEYILLDHRRELKKDHSRGLIKEWNDGYFNSQVAFESEIVLFPVTQIENLDSVIAKAIDEVDFLYNGFKTTLKNKNLKLATTRRDEQYEACSDFFRSNKSEFQILQKSFIVNDSKYWATSNPSRDIKGGILEQYLMRNHKKLYFDKNLPTNYQQLYDHYRRLKNTPKKFSFF